MDKFLISITEAAKNRIKSITRDYLIENGINVYIRLSIKKMGCSGFSHCMEFATEPPEKIHFIEDLPLFVEPKSFLFLVGTAIDYLDEGVRSGFTFTNAANSGSCHCGKAVYR